MWCSSLLTTSEESWELVCFSVPGVEKSPRLVCSVQIALFKQREVLDGSLFKCELFSEAERSHEDC